MPETDETLPVPTLPDVPTPGRRRRTRTQSAVATQTAVAAAAAVTVSGGTTLLEHVVQDHSRRLTRVEQTQGVLQQEISQTKEIAHRTEAKVDTFAAAFGQVNWTQIVTSVERIERDNAEQTRRTQDMLRLLKWAAGIVSGFTLPVLASVVLHLSAGPQTLVVAGSWGAVALVALIVYMLR